VLGRVWSWATPLLLALAWLGRDAGKKALACAVVLFVVHAALAHKEYRFVYPVIALVVTVAGVGAGRLVTLIPAPRRLPIAAALVGAWLLASVQLARSYSTADTTMGVALSPPSGHFEHLRGGLSGLGELSRDDAVCGVGLFGLRWFLTGGYAWLHRRVPLYELASLDELAARGAHLNAVLGWATPRPLPAPYTQTRCWGAICLWQRPGACAPDPGYDLNRVLEERGE
jgi:GPI mannosyltransferase 3